MWRLSNKMGISFNQWSHFVFKAALSVTVISVLGGYRESERFAKDCTASQQYWGSSIHQETHAMIFTTVFCKPFSEWGDSFFQGMFVGLGSSSRVQCIAYLWPYLSWRRASGTSLDLACPLNLCFYTVKIVYPLWC